MLGKVFGLKDQCGVEIKKGDRVYVPRRSLALNRYHSEGLDGVYGTVTGFTLMRDTRSVAEDVHTSLACPGPRQGRRRNDLPFIFVCEVKMDVRVSRYEDEPLKFYSWDVVKPQQP